MEYFRCSNRDYFLFRKQFQSGISQLMIKSVHFKLIKLWKSIALNAENICVAELTKSFVPISVEMPTTIVLIVISTIMFGMLISFLKRTEGF
jgi:hypothetical protein